MKYILMLSMVTILLLGCSDSKENKSVRMGMDAQITSRAIAQRYQVSTNDDVSVKCYPNVTKQENGIQLTNGQQVALVTGNEVIVILKDIQWLHVYAKSDQQQPCYVKTNFLKPVPDY